MLKPIGTIEDISHKFLDAKLIKKTLHELKKPMTKEKKKTVVNGTLGLVLLVGVVAIATPLVKAQLQNGEVDKIETVVLQQNTADFLQLNTTAVNYANSTLGDIYALINTGFTEEQYQVLVAKKEGLLAYKSQLVPSNPLFLDVSENTIQKITILLTAIDNFLDQSTPLQEDVVKLNVYTLEYKKAFEEEQVLLMTLLDTIGMPYEVLSNGQIKYEYLKVSQD